MICPACGAKNNDSRTHCRVCGHEFKKKARPLQILGDVLFYALRGVIFLLMAAVLCVGIYKLYYWYADFRLARTYSHSALAPSIETVTLDDGRSARAITFYGNDGDSVYIPELDCAYRISGSMARVEIADADWFTADPDDVESAHVTLTPTLMTSGGDRRLLPQVQMDIDTPVAPLEMISPATDYTNVFTSVYNLNLKVAPASTLYVNGEDVTDSVDFQGNLTLPINVYAQGDNNISILVDTQGHKQNRNDIVLYRAPQSIRLEPSLDLATKSTTKLFTVSGIMDPTARLSVDSPYDEKSVEVEENGSFTFDAKLEEIGDNTITFRASKDGVEDTVMSVNVYYVPSLNEYGNKAWAMDYEQLCVMTDVWEGRVFLCKGKIVEIEDENGKHAVIMNVGTEENVQLVALENLSERTVEKGATYRAYADVINDLYFYDQYKLPHLNARYILLP